MNKAAFYLCFFVLLYIGETHAQIPKNGIRLMRVIDMTKLMNLEIDDATIYLTEFNYDLVKTEGFIDYENCLCFRQSIIGKMSPQIIICSSQLRVNKIYYLVSDISLRKLLNDNIKEMNLKKSDVTSSDKGIVTHYSGKSFTYEKTEFINKYDKQQVNFTILLK